MMLLSQSVFAQGAGDNGSFYLVATLVIVGALILVSAVLTLSQSLISAEATKVGLEEPKTLGFSLSSLTGGSAPSYTKGQSFVNLTKGHDILLSGEATKEIADANITRFAVRPPNFRGLEPIPKVVVEVGDEVKAGDVIFHGKKDDTVKYVSPVSGEVVEVRRGDKRAITEVIILADKEIKYKQFDPPSITESSREDIVAFLTESGGWTMLNQRPYDVLPEVDATPKNIFISTFDTAPLAPDNNLVVEGKGELFQKGLDTLARLTEGKVYLGLDGNGESAPSSVFTEASGVEKVYFAGKHPSGNVGVQIHHIAPIKAGDKVWTLGVQEVITLGELMYKGIYNAQRIIAVAGSQVAKPHYAKTYIGANIGELLKDQLGEEKVRIIAGDVLSGRQTDLDGFMDVHADQLTVIEEGDYYEMFGWLLPIKPRPTISKTFPNFLYPKLKFDGDTNMHGEKRAFVVTGQYEKVLPMNLYPQHLLKAVMTGDFEQMEGLGIYELSEEDLALCEFVCTSKMPLQSILRDGLDMMREQG